MSDAPREDLSMFGTMESVDEVMARFDAERGTARFVYTNENNAGKSTWGSRSRGFHTTIIGLA